MARLASAPRSADERSGLRAEDSAGRCCHCLAWQWQRDGPRLRDEARAPQAGRAGRLRDQRRDAARTGARRCPARDRRAARRAADDGSSAARSIATRWPGPGFLNLFLSDEWHRGALRDVLDAGERFGADGARKPERILLEFVSANPTGRARRRQRPPRRLRRLARPDPAATTATPSRASTTSTTPARRSGGSASRCARVRSARSRPRTATRASTSRISPRRSTGAADESVDVDAIWPPRRGHPVRADQGHADPLRRRSSTTSSASASLHEGSPSALDRAIADVREAGHVYEHDGAVWLRTTTFGDDKDRVLLRSGGEPTYFAADVAYMLNKRTAASSGSCCRWAPTTTATRGA